jgi:hypothetical protein
MGNGSVLIWEENQKTLQVQAFFSDIVSFVDNVEIYGTVREDTDREIYGTVREDTDREI